MSYNKPNLTQRQFVIYAINNAYTNSEKEGVKYITQYLPITFFDGVNSSRFSTYDENLQVKENAQYSLTFSVAKYSDNEVNPFFYLFVENRRLRLQTYEDKIDFIITGITPTITNNNVVYAITCQDTFSWDLSKQNILLSYETVGPENIKTIASSIMAESKLARWQIDPSLESSYYADFPDLQLVSPEMSDATKKMQASISLSDTTPYSALVEVCNLFNAVLKIEYPDDVDSKGIIYFKNKDSIKYKGYSLRPEVNLNSFSVSRKADNFCSLLRISGGDDADGALVSIVPTIPTDVQEYLISLYPRVVKTEAEVGSLKATITTDRFVTRFEDRDNYTLYTRSGVSWQSKENYTPWTLMTSKEIQTDFLSMTKPGSNASQYSTNDPQEINEFFTFLVKNCPSAGSIFYDFSYYKEAGLIPNQTYENLNRMFDIKLRNSNLLVYCLNTQYYSLNNKLESYIDQEEEFVAQLAALNEEYYDVLVEGKENTIVNNVDYSGDLVNGTLSRDTILNSIINKKVSTIQDMMTAIWTEDYCKLLLTFKGVSAVDDKISELNNKKSDAISKRDGYLLSATTVLNNYAPVGAYSFGEVATVPSGVTADYGYVFIVDKENTDIFTLYVYLYRGNFVNSGGNQEKIGLSSYTGWYNLNILGARLSKVEDVSDATVTTGNITTRVIEIVQTGKKYTYTMAVTTEDREQYLSISSQTQYTNYVTYKSKADNYLTYVDSSKTMNDSNGVEVTYTREGYYTTYIAILKNFKDLASSPWVKVSTTYTDPLNIVQWRDSALVGLNNVWLEIYEKYSDYICESQYSDSDQLSSSGLYMAALKQFSTYSRPTYEYSSTIINQNQLVDLASDEVQVGDLVYMYNKELKSDYAGRIIVKVPYNGNFGISSKCKLYFDNSSSSLFDRVRAASLLTGKEFDDLTVSNVETKNGYCNIYIDCDIEKANDILFNKAQLNMISTGFNTPLTILGIEQERKISPVELQVTGLTKKLREGTTQLTVSNDRVVKNILSRLVKQARL